MTHRTRFDEKAGAVNSGGVSNPVVYNPLYITLTWTHSDSLPTAMIRGFRIVLFEGYDPNDTSQYLVSPKEVGPSDRSCVITLRVPESTLMNAAIQTLYNNGNESSWRLISGSVVIDPDTKSLADKAGLDATTLTANTALQMAYAVAEDGVLSRGEKPNFIILYNTAVSDYSSLYSKATSAGVNTAQFSTAFSNLSASVTSLSPAYDDTTQDTVITSPSDWNATWTAWNAAKTEILIKIIAAAPSSADGVVNSNVSNLSTNASQPNIDGVLRSAGNRLLLINQTTKSQNGLYVLNYSAPQASAQNIWANSYSESYTGVIVDPSNAWDNSGSPNYSPNNATYATVSTDYPARYVTLYGFPGSTAVSGSIKLDLTPHINESNTGTYTEIRVEYSLDSGSTWTNHITYNNLTYNGSLQNLSIPFTGVAPQNIQVRVHVIGLRDKEWDRNGWLYFNVGCSARVHSAYVYAPAVGSANWSYVKLFNVIDDSTWRVSSGTSFGGKTYVADVAVDNSITLTQTVAAYQAPLGSPSQDGWVLKGTIGGSYYWEAINPAGGADASSILGVNIPSLSSGLLRYTGSQFQWDNNSYALSTHSHNIDQLGAGGASAGYVLLATGATTYGWAQLQWSHIGGKPTTLAGYGIVDAASSTHNHSGVYQPLDADLTSIAGLAGTSGFLKKTAANTWTLDTNTYSLSSHNHDGVYSPAGHNHDGTYALYGHNHDGVYSPAGHNHDGTYALYGHNHTFASLTSKPTTLAGYGITDAATSGHTHAIDQIGAGNAAAGYTLRAINAVSYGWAETPYPFNVTYTSKPAASQKVLIFPAERAFIVKSTGHKGKCYTVPTTTAVTFSLQKNGTQFGTVAFATSGAFTMSVTQTSFAVDDIFTIVAPSSQNSTFADFGFVIAAILA